MTRRLISSGSAFEKTAGYSRAVAVGPWCFVSGTTGYDYATMSMPETTEDQTRNALQTISKALAEAGFGLADTVRVHYYVATEADAAKVFSVTGAFFGEVRPAATIVVCGLLKPGQPDFQLGQRLADADQQLVSFGGQFDLARGALEHRNAQLIFELLDLHADGGQRAIGLYRGLAEARILGDRQKGGQELEIDVHGGSMECSNK